MKLLSLITPTEAEFNDAVQNVLRGAEYKNLRGSLRALIERIRDSIARWLMRTLDRAFSNMDNLPRVSKNLSTIFMIIGFLIILAIIILIAVKISKTLEKKARIKEILGEKIDGKTTPLTLKSKAEDYNKQGEIRLAIRYHFIALLLLMHEHSLLYLDETKTNQEIYNYLRKSSFSQLQLFKFLIDVFNSSWYGHKLCSQQTYHDWQHKLNLIWDEVNKHEI